MFEIHSSTCATTYSVWRDSPPPSTPDNTRTEEETAVWHTPYAPNHSLFGQV